MVFQIRLNRMIPRPSSFKRHFARRRKTELAQLSLKGLVVSNIALVEAFHPTPAGQRRAWVGDGSGNRGASPNMEDTNPRARA
jgi:hypothetical protein